jgi:hypothetical protein
MARKLYVCHKSITSRVCSNDLTCRTATRQKHLFQQGSSRSHQLTRNTPRLAICHFLKWLDPSSMGLQLLVLTWRKRQVSSLDLLASGTSHIGKQPSTSFVTFEVRPSSA